MKKYENIVLCVVIILLSLSLSPIALGDTSHILQTNNTSVVNNSVLIVDINGEGDYTSITDAINNASTGDTINVYSGRYKEHNIKINTSDLSLIGIPYEYGTGNYLGKPFIDGEGAKTVVITVLAPFVVISGFRIANYKAGNNYPSGVLGVQPQANGCMISDNDIGPSIFDSIVVFSGNNSIINNTISHSIMRRGIIISNFYGNGADSNIISGNVISDMGDVGIALWNSSNNIISGNYITRCHSAIELYGNYNVIEGNSFVSIRSHAIFLYPGYHTIVSRNNFIRIQTQYPGRRGAGFSIRLFNPILHNTWYNNYWGRPRILPYAVFGGHYFVTRVNFDWRPALRPHIIDNKLI